MILEKKFEYVEEIIPSGYEILNQKYEVLQSHLKNSFILISAYGYTEAWTRSMSIIHVSLCFQILVEILSFKAINISMPCSVVEDFGIHC